MRLLVAARSLCPGVLALLAMTSTVGGTAALAAQPRTSGAKHLVLAAPEQSALPAATRALAAAIVQELLGMREGAAWSPIGAVANSSGDLDSHLNKALADARSSFDALDLETAAARYEAALARLDKLAPLVADKLIASRALLMLGATHLLLGDAPRAETYLARAAGIDPDLAIDPTAFSPAMQPAFARAVQSVRGAPTQALRISSTPTGAVVYANGRFAGTTPLELNGMPAAPTLLQVAHEGFETHSEVIAPMPGAVAGRDITLTRSQALARELAAARAAVSKLDEGGLPMAAHSIALARRAERIYVLWSDGSNHRLVVTTPDGRDRSERTTRSALGTAATARSIARMLLGHAQNDPAPPLPTARPLVAMPSTTTGASPATGPNLRQQSQPDTERGLFSHNAAKNRTLWCLYSAAIAAGGAASYFGVRALDAQSEYDRVAYENPAQYDHAGTTDQVEGRAVAERGDTAATTADILGVSAAALALTAIVLHVVWDPEARETTASPAKDGRGAWSLLDVSLAPRRDGASILVGSNF